MASTSEWTKRTSPILGLYGPSGEGKTTLIATLFEDDDYWPCLFIDLDEGDSTIAKYTRNPKIVDYRSESQRDESQDEFQWLVGVLNEAKTSDHKSIVIEGLTGYRDDLVGKEILKNPGLASEPYGLKRAYIVPSTVLSSIFAGISAIKKSRKRRGTGAPIIVSLNTKRLEVDNTTHVNVPNLSHNLTENIKRRSDVFAELRLPPRGQLRLFTRRGPNNDYRKARNDTVATALDNMRDPSLSEVLDMWASTEQIQIDETAAWAATNQTEETTDG